MSWSLVNLENHSIFHFLPVLSTPKIFGFQGPVRPQKLKPWFLLRFLISCIKQRRLSRSVSLLTNWLFWNLSFRTQVANRSDFAKIGGLGGQRTRKIHFNVKFICLNTTTHWSALNEPLMRTISQCCLVAVGFREKSPIPEKCIFYPIAQTTPLSWSWWNLAGFLIWTS